MYSDIQNQNYHGINENVTYTPVISDYLNGENHKLIISFQQASNNNNTNREKKLQPKLTNIELFEDKFRQKLVDTCTDEVIVLLSDKCGVLEILKILNNATHLGITVRLIPEKINENIIKNLRIIHRNGHWILKVTPGPSKMMLIMKRTIDVVVSIALLILLAPLLAIIAAAIKISTSGPVFFSQVRVGKHNKKFVIHKFRSMVNDAEDRKKLLDHLNEQEGPVFKIEKDPRVTKIGRLLRRTSLDELPQLWNVLTGNMSLVGPRPPLAEEVMQYKWKYRKRLTVKPGLTCTWQISGRSNIPFKKWMEMDHAYIDRWSLWLDIKILLLTIPAVIAGRGAT